LAPPERFLQVDPELETRLPEEIMRWLPIVAVVLVVLWVAAKALGWVLGAALHLFWIAALVLFALWIFGKVRRRV
jgi:hypothetical protein